MARSSASGSSSKQALDLSDPYTNAQHFLRAHYLRDDAITLRHHQDTFYVYSPSTAWRAAETRTLRAGLYSYVARAPLLMNGSSNGVTCKPTAARIHDLIEAMKALTHWPSNVPPPCWISGVHAYDPLDLLAFPNGLLHVPTRTLIPVSPDFFTLNALNFPYDPAPAPPLTWFTFLEQILPGDLEAQHTLQEWIGYLLTARTHHQKMLMIVGPKRSGKGTIGRIIRELVGQHNLVAPSLSNLGQQFGRASLIDKPVALIADARLSGRSDVAVLSEVLLSISGEDAQTIPRKNIEDWTGTLPTRFTIFTNEIPRFGDSSGALASRFVMVTFRESFYGREDQTLFARLLPELPGILHWALDGLARLNTRGYFVTPSSAEDAVHDLERLSSPISAFVADMCLIQQGLTCTKDLLYKTYTEWCTDIGQHHHDSSPVFFRNLYAAFPFLGRHRLGTRTEREGGISGIGIRTEDDNLYIT